MLTKPRFPEVLLGILLAVAIFAMGMLFAPSYQPSPAAKNQSQQTEATAQDHAGSKPSTAESTKADQGHEKQESKSAFWSAKLTDWLLAALTGLLVLFTYRLWKSTDKLWTAGEKQIEISGKMAEVADRQLAIIGHQTDIQMKQHAIGRLQYLATHRPRLHVRHVTITTGKVMPNMPTFHFGHEAKNGYLVVVNGGGSRADIIETRYRIFATKSGLPPEAPYDDDYRTDLLIPAQSLEIGESCVCKISDKLVMPFDADMGQPIDQFEREGWSLYVMGQIRYQDEGGAERFMAFCRVRQSNGRFHAVDDPDYEYED